MTELAFQSIPLLSDRIARRAISPTELVRELLDRISRYNPVLHSYISVAETGALHRAASLEAEMRAGGYRGPLHGIPIVHKDVICTRELPTTAHSRVLDDFPPVADAAIVANLERAGMILLGKTNTNEFANGGTEIYGTPRNPWNTDHFSGGSSAGSGASVAAGLAVAATGSDTGGSIRAPASFCGIVGFKPTHGLVPVAGLIPLSWSMDHVGPMTRTVFGNALLLGAMVGVEGAKVPKAFGPGPELAVEGMTVGVPEDHFFEGLDPGVEASVQSALAHLEALGCHLVPLRLPRAGDLAAAASIIVAVEAYAQHATWLRRHWRRYGVRARRRLSSGAFYSAADYQLAGQVRQLWMRELNAAMATVDVLVTPTQRILAPTVQEEETDPPDTSWGTRHFNLSGHPAITIPCGFAAGGLPVGLQIVGPHFAEKTVIRLAHAYETTTEWHSRRPSLEGVS